MNVKIEDLIKDIDSHIGTNSTIKLDTSLLGTRLLKQAREVLLDMESAGVATISEDTSVENVHELNFMESSDEPPDPKPYIDNEKGRNAYHYCATPRSDLTFVMMDGIMLLQNKISDYDGYMYVKKLIAKEAGVDINNIAITSFTYLGKESG